MNKKIKIEIASGIIAVVAIVIGFLVWQNEKEIKFENPENQISEIDGNKKEEPVFCTQEVRLCLDGNYVGRTGPNCEFTACPEEK